MTVHLTAALEYAARGWHVLPLHPATLEPVLPRHDSIGCDHSDPWCLGGHTTWEPRATTDTDRILRLWRATPWAIGIALGPSGLLVIDTAANDPTAAEAALYDLAARYGRLPSTWSVSPPGGGLHRYYTNPRHISPTPGSLGPLITVLGAGSYVVAPPTTASEGTYLALISAPAAPMPDWLEHILTQA